MEFLYPTSRMFPFDEVCEAIVRELAKRNMKVPGMEVTIDEYGSGEQKLRHVYVISGTDFKLWFCRGQGQMPGGRWNDVAAVSRIYIPGKELGVYEDNSGPSFYLYVGKDWKKDREKFMNSVKVNSKLRHEQRLYLRYDGRGRTLVHTNDLGREYDPKGKEPRYFITAAIMAEMRDYLEEKVLKFIKLQPIPDVVDDLLAVPEPIPYPPSISLFCFGDYRGAERIRQGKKDPKILLPADRFFYTGGTRLMTLSMKNDGTVPEVAYEGFIWCGLGKVTKKTPINTLEVPGHYRWSDRERYLIRVIPNRANEIYIADHGQFEMRSKEIDNSSNSYSFTGREVVDIYCARARTLIPITEYQGQFVKPVVLINRELDFDEVEVVSEDSNPFGRR